jgi:hypothetical protein
MEDEIGWVLSTHGGDEYIQNLGRKVWSKEATGETQPHLGK